jgi:diguanylate cyclase (GGDEF)-like protein
VNVVDWSKLPDLVAVAFLACAFASVARRSQTPVSSLWVTGWVMVAVHFAAFMFAPAPGAWGIFAITTGLASLTWAGVLFMWASVPYRVHYSSPLMLVILLVTNTLYVTLITIAPESFWELNLAAALLGLSPLALALALFSLRRFSHPLRWTLVLLYSLLSLFLLVFQHRPGDGAYLALNAVLCTVYLGCCIHFLYSYRRPTTGAFITIAGFLAWAAVFVVGPVMAAYLPQVHLESEVWNLPKYVVAVGMILLLLEKQIEDSNFLALHDELTGLPNRRLFQDRLSSALERARRTGAQTALLLVDLDDFKQVNDLLGHHSGDLLLQQVSSMLAGRIRRSDTVARTGGDEFCIILEEPTSRVDAERVGGFLMHLLKEPIEIGDHTVRVGASIGIAVFPEDASEMEALCIAADLRMYAEKQGSRPKGKRGMPGMEIAPRVLRSSTDKTLRPIE